MKDNALYLEVDEDITSAIDKLAKSEGDSVQIVVPKRSTMLQSIINLKLLKKAAETNGKELVLVTGDRIAGDLAARVGLAVAPSVGAKPVIKEADIPEDLKSNEEIIDAGDPEPPDATPEKKEPAKRLLIKRKEVSDGPPDDALAAALPTDAPDEEPGNDKAAAAAAKPKIKVPSLKKLQRRLLWAGLAAFLVVAYLLGMYLFSTATVTLYANGTKVGIDTSFTVDPAAKSSDPAKAVLAGQVITVNKDLSGPFTPTGKKDVGTKSTGKMTISNGLGVDQPLVTGTRFEAPDGKLFRSTADVTVPKAYLNAGGSIVNGTATVDVTADQAGDSYNQAPAAYTLPALSNPKITAQGGQMSGGTTKTVTVATQGDVDTAKAAILDKDKEDAERDIKGRLPEGHVALDASKATTVASLNAAPAVGAEGTTGQLTLKVTYTVLAVDEKAYTELVEAQELKQIGENNQIYDNGLENAQITASEKDGSGKQNFHLTTEAYGGAKLNKEAVAKAISGKRYGDATDHVTSLPGISRAEIHLSPAWSTSLPQRPAKIKIDIQVAENKE
jgi:hypothetical protein